MSEIEHSVSNKADEKIRDVDRAITSAEDEFLRTGKMFDARETLAALRKKHFE